MADIITDAARLATSTRVDLETLVLLYEACTLTRG